MMSRILRNGAVMMIQKPIDFSQLNSTVKQLGHKGMVVPG
jgi:FixJ family two-component response regulator